MKQNFGKSIFLLLSFVWVGCSEQPAPPEVKAAQHVEQHLWRAGAPEKHPSEYQRYLKNHRYAKDRFIKERGRFAWFRDYGPVVTEYRILLSLGTSILAEIRHERETKGREVDSQYAFYQNKIKTLSRLTDSMNEGRLARKNLTKAQLLLSDTDRLRRLEEYDQARASLFEVGICLKSAEAALRPILSRYSDRGLVAKWQRWVEETVRASGSNGGMAIVVSKAERNMIIYRGGKPWKTYTVGLGQNGLADKLYSGDRATPEGKYFIIQKLIHSKYYKALLINYPNEEDWKQFVLAKKQGLIPQRTAIGGSLEIHGGGNEGMTYGCIALDDNYMEEVFNLVEVGTPVTIVGSTDYNNCLSNAIDDL